MALSRRSLILLLTTVSGMVLVILSPGLMLFGRLAYDSWEERQHRIPFDSERWKDPAHVESKDPVRIRMVDDLIQSHRLDGRTRAEVDQMLGKRTATNYFSGHELVYWLGPERGFMSMDSEWLLIDFGTNGRVSSYQIARD